MKIGKVPNDILRDIVLGKIIYKHSEVLVKPGIGEDCSAIDFGENICVLSSDPITGAVNDIGRLAVHVSCNDVASCGVEPVGLLTTILLPPGTDEKELDAIMGQLSKTAASINVDILGGHTEVTDAVTRVVIICTAVGKVLKSKLITTSGAKTGDYVVMTKSAGIEGTAVIAADREKELINAFGIETVERSKAFIDIISVVAEGVVAGNFGVSAMHDATEGGILGAVWEVAEASGKGVQIYREKIPVADETRKITEFYGIDPLKLISSGCMIITCENGGGLVERLNEKGIGAAVIGRITDEPDKLLFSYGRVEEIKQPETDELYKVV